jgi:hypothetical protein
MRSKVWLLGCLFLNLGCGKYFNLSSSNPSSGNNACSAEFVSDYREVQSLAKSMNSAGEAGDEDRATDLLISFSERCNRFLANHEDEAGCTANGRSEAVNMDDLSQVCEEAADRVARL